MRPRHALALLALSALVVASASSAASTKLTSVVFVTGGGGHALAVRKDATVMAWGYNAHGQIGIGKAGTPETTPVKVKNLTGVSSVTGGEFHSLALKSDGTIFGWGENDHGQLGTGQKGGPIFLPTRAKAAPKATAIDADGAHSYALTKSGKVWAWGENDVGQLGDGTTTDRATPRPIAGLSGVTAIAAGGSHALALEKSGSKTTVYGWGQDRYGQVGDGKSCNTSSSGSSTCNRTRPVQTKGLPATITAIAAAQLGDYSLALAKDGTVWSWGRNDQGQLGRGKFTTGGCKCIAPPGRVKGLSGVKAIAASGGSGVALKKDGTVWVWGNNAFGQLGNGKKGGQSATAAQVKGLTGVKAIGAGGGSVQALLPNGTVKAWGINSFGELGDGTTTDSPNPVLVGSSASSSTSGTTTTSGGSSGGGSSFPTTTIILAAVAGLALLIAAGALTMVRRGRKRASAAAGPGAGSVPGGGVAAAGPPRPQPRDPDAWKSAWSGYGRKVWFLSRVPLLQGVGEEGLAEISAALKERVVPAGTTVVRQGDPAGEFLLIESGTLAVDVDGREGGQLTAGDHFGQQALLGDGRQPATVRATTEAQLWALAAADFNRLLVRSPEVADRLRSAQPAPVADRAPAPDGQPDVQNLATLLEQHGRVRIGRELDNDLVLASLEVSRHHALVEWADGSCRLTDLGSANGTFVNGARVETCDLQDGDRVVIGDEPLVFDRRTAAAGRARG